jgi:hypothetical protein
MGQDGVDVSAFNCDILAHHALNPILVPAQTARPIVLQLDRVAHLCSGGMCALHQGGRIRQDLTVCPYPKLCPLLASL